MSHPRLSRIAEMQKMKSGAAYLNVPILAPRSVLIREGNCSGESLS
jgi:hypothetical protein